MTKSDDRKARPTNTVDELILRRGASVPYGSQWGDGEIEWRTRPKLYTDADFLRREMQAELDIANAKRGAADDTVSVAVVRVLELVGAGHKVTEACHLAVGELARNGLHGTVGSVRQRYYRKK